MRSQLTVGCIDVGGDPGWALVDNRGRRAGSRLDALVNAVVQALRAGRGVALGFEFPLYVPRRANVSAALKGRSGEGTPPWCVRAGAHSLAVGLGQADAVLSAIQRKCPAIVGTTRPPEFESGIAKLLISEAYVPSRQGEDVRLPKRLSKHSVLNNAA